ncbi:MAG: MoaD/ThiS family protein [Chloroflexi bacterium]|nr:MoaD/ThiS family protein [Chloroflexota bacterium]
MARVTLYGGLRRHVSAPMQQLDSVTMRDAELQAALFENDRPRPHVRVLVNGRNLEWMRGLDTPLEQDHQVAIFPPIAGGTP